jgi:hypothetical protein
MLRSSKRLWAVGVVLAVATGFGGLLAWPGVALAVVSQTEYLRTYSAGQTVSLWYGKTADLKVSGDFLDLAIRAEVRTPAGALAAGWTANIISRTKIRGVPVIVVRVVPGGSVALGNYEVWIRYAIETSGPDKVRVRLFDVGRVDSVSGAERVKFGEDYTFTVRGARLGQARLNTAALGNSISHFTEISRTANSYSFRLRFTELRVMHFRAADFYDRNLPASSIPATPMRADEAQYQGPGSWSGLVHINPKVTGVSSTTPRHWTDITISGTNLKPKLYTVSLQFRDRQKPTYATFERTETLPIVEHKLKNESITVLADQRWDPDAIELVYSTTEPGFPQRVVVPLGVPVHVIGKPTIIDHPGAQLWTGNEPRFINAGQHRFRGHNLVAAPDSRERSRVRTGAASNAAQLRFGEGRGLAIGANKTQHLAGRDELVFTVPQSNAPVISRFVLFVNGESVESDEYMYLPPPRNVSIAISDGPNRLIPHGSNRLKRGHQYLVTGENVCFTRPSPWGGQTILPGPEIKLDGRRISMGLKSGNQLPPSNCRQDMVVVFQVLPNTALGVGTLTVSHYGGTATVGTYEIVE